jgi:hypothetical protein
MADEDIESGGQTEDTGDTSTDEVDDAPEADAGERQAATDDAPARAPRGERRKHAMREAAMARQAAERDRDELRSRLAAQDQQMAELRRTVEERQQQTRQQDASTEKMGKVKQLREQAQLYLARAAEANNNPTLAREYWNKHQELTDEAEDIRREIWAEKEWERRRGEIQGQIPNQDMLSERQYISAKYPWVETNIEGRSLADGRFAALLRSGRPATRQTMEEALTYAAKMLRLGGGSAPSEASRQRYAGFAARDGQDDDGASSGSMSAEEVENSLPLKRMALAAYPQLEAPQAFAKFAKDIGSKAKRQGA